MEQNTINIFVGDLVYYVGPPIVNPLRWEYIVENNNGIISKTDLGVVVDSDCFLRIADVFIQKYSITLERISFNHLVIAQ